MKLLPAVLALFLLNLICLPALASEPIQPTLKIGYGAAEGFIEEDDTGVGAALLKAVSKELEKIGYKIEFTKAPFNRIVHQYAKGHLDIAYPIISGDYMSLPYFAKWNIPFIPLYSMPVYNGGSFAIFTLNNHPVYNSVTDLKDLHIGVLAGVYMPNELKAPTEYNVTEIHETSSASKLLKSGRIDALILHKNWAESVLSSEDRKVLHQGDSFSHIYGSFATQPTSNGAVILAEINKIIARMVIDGRYKQLLNRHSNLSSIIPYSQ